MLEHMPRRGPIQELRSETLVTRSDARKNGVPRRYTKAVVALALGQTLELRLASPFSGEAPGSSLVFVPLGAPDQYFMNKVYTDDTWMDRLILSDGEWGDDPFAAPSLRPVSSQAPHLELTPTTPDAYRLDRATDQHRFGRGVHAQRLLLMLSLMEREPHGSHRPIPPELVEKYGEVGVGQSPLDGTPEIHITMPKDAPGRPPHEVGLRVVEGEYAFGLPPGA